MLTSSFFTTGHSEIMHLLIEAGAKLEIRECFVFTRLQTVCKNPQIKIRHGCQRSIITVDLFTCVRENLFFVKARFKKNWSRMCEALRGL